MPSSVQLFVGGGKGACYQSASVVKQQNSQVSGWYVLWWRTHAIRWKESLSLSGSASSSTW